MTKSSIRLSNMTVVGPIRSMGCSPKRSRPMTRLEERRIARRKNKGFLEMRHGHIVRRQGWSLARRSVARR
jgi:hypothetical protein